MPVSYTHLDVYKRQGPSTVLREGDVLVVACNVTDLSFVAELVE